MIAQQLSKEGLWHSGSLKVHSSCDLKASARLVLAAHRGPAASAHVFEDVCNMMPKPIVTLLQDNLKKFRAEAESRIAATQCLPEKKQIVEEQGRYFLAEQLEPVPG